MSVNCRKKGCPPKLRDIAVQGASKVLPVLTEHVLSLCNAESPSPDVTKREVVRALHNFIQNGTPDEAKWAEVLLHRLEGLHNSSEEESDIDSDFDSPTSPKYVPTP